MIHDVSEEKKGFLIGWLNSYDPISQFNLMLSILVIPSLGDTGDAGYWLEKGNEHCNSGQMEEALQAYGHALSIDGSLIDAWNNKGMVLAHLGRIPWRAG